MKIPRATFELATLLAAGSVRDVDPPQHPPQGDAAWDALIGAADRHLVLPALAASLERLDLLSAAPQPIQGLLAACREANAERNAALREELRHSVTTLNEAGIVPLVLKGGIRLFDDLYPDGGWRLLTDLDLLVGETQCSAAYAALANSGYAIVEAGKKPELGEHHHLPPIARAGSRGAIELHARLQRSRVASALPQSSLHYREADLDGARLLVPDHATQLRHTIAHAQINHGVRYSGCAKLRDLHETWLLMRRLGNEASAGVVEQLGLAGYSASTEKWLMLCSLLFDGGEAKTSWLGRFWMRGFARAEGGVAATARQQIRGAYLQILANWSLSDTLRLLPKLLEVEFYSKKARTVLYLLKMRSNP